VTRLLLAAYFLEAGLVLIVAPWSAFWERNFFVHRMPQLADFLSSPIARGAVSGIGLVTTIAGLAEFGGAFHRRTTPESPAGSAVHSDQ
jgi:hypothetical protein